MVRVGWYDQTNWVNALGTPTWAYGIPDSADECCLSNLHNSGLIYVNLEIVFCELSVTGD